jgi:hypothetical protein
VEGSAAGDVIGTGTKAPSEPVEVEVETWGSCDDVVGSWSLGDVDSAGNVMGTRTKAPSEFVEVEVETMGASGSAVEDAPSVCDVSPAPEGAGTGTAVGLLGACGPGGVTGGPRRSVLHLIMVSMRDTNKEARG